MAWHTVSSLEALKPPSWLIPDYLPTGAMAQLGGRSGIGKTFLAIAWACSLAVAGKRVAYFVGEGLRGIASRVRAWEEYHDLVVPERNLLIRSGVVPLTRRDQVERVLRELDPLNGGVDLLVLDTWARCMAGGDENSTADVSAALTGVEAIRKRAGDEATALAITHFGWAGERQRGNSALYAACDTVVYLKPLTRRGSEEEVPYEDEHGDIIMPSTEPTRRSFLVVDKQRDGADDIAPVVFERTPVGASCVLVPQEKVTQLRAPAKSNGHGGQQDKKRKFVEGPAKW